MICCKAFYKQRFNYDIGSNFQNNVANVQRCDFVLFLLIPVIKNGFDGITNRIYYCLII